MEIYYDEYECYMHQKYILSEWTAMKNYHKRVFHFVLNLWEYGVFPISKTVLLMSVDF